jgi:hypothetical protein
MGESELTVIDKGPDGISFTIEGNDVTIKLSWVHVYILWQIRNECIWESKAL